MSNDFVKEIISAAAEKAQDNIDRSDEIQAAIHTASEWFTTAFNGDQGKAEDALSAALSLATAYMDAGFMSGFACGLQLSHCLDALTDAKQMREVFYSLLNAA